MRPDGGLPLEVVRLVVETIPIFSPNRREGLRASEGSQEMKRLVGIILIFLMGCGDDGLFDMTTIATGDSSDDVNVAWECSQLDGDTVFRIGFYTTQTWRANVVDSTIAELDGRVFFSAGPDSFCTKISPEDAGCTPGGSIFFKNVSGSIDDEELLFTLENAVIGGDGDYSCALISCIGTCF